MPKFIIFEKSIRKVELSDPVITVGRDQDNHIVISDPLLSRKHCLFEFSGDSLQVIDLKSANGTYVNGIRIERQELFPEDRVKIGNTLIFVASL